MFLKSVKSKKMQVNYQIIKYNAIKKKKRFFIVKSIVFTFDVVYACVQGVTKKPDKKKIDYS